MYRRGVRHNMQMQKNTIHSIVFKEKLLKILLAIFVLFFSVFVLSTEVPKMKFVKMTIEQLEEDENTVMDFSGATIAISLAMTALPEDFASPLAETVSDMNIFFVFIFAVLFVEKFLVVEGIKISFSYIMPIVCILYIFLIISQKDVWKKLATKFFILGISIVVVVPFSVHFKESVGADYLAYVDETIAETEAGANKVKEVMGTDDGKTTIFEKLSDAFKTAIQGVSDLLTYFKNIIKKCIHSVVIMLVTTFVFPIIIFLFFKWLLKELFSINLPITVPKIRLPHMQEEKIVECEEGEE